MPKTIVSTLPLEMLGERVLCLFCLWLEWLERLEEVVALVIYENEGGEVDDLDLPDGFHTELGILDTLDLLDAVLSKDGGRASDTTEVKSSVLLTSVGDLLTAVALGDHDHAATMRLEEIDIRVHTPCGGRTERTGWHTFRRLGWTCIVDGVILDILWQTFSSVYTFFELGMGDVSTHDDRTREGESCGDRILR